MAQIDTKQAARGKPPMTTKGVGLPFTKANYYIFAVGLLVIILGFVALAQGSITLAPILLVLGYCVIMPIAILYRGKEPQSSSDSKGGA